MRQDSNRSGKKTTKSLGVVAGHRVVEPRAGFEPATCRSPVRGLRGGRSPVTGIDNLPG